MQQYHFNIFQYTAIVLGLVFIVITIFIFIFPSNVCACFHQPALLRKLPLCRANLTVEMSLSTEITFLPTLRVADATSPAKYKII